VLNVEVPPLRERGQDILLLARYFMQQACAQIQRPVCRLAPGTYPALLGNRWPGNVRQLQNVIFRAAAICESSLVDIGDLDIAGTSVARQKRQRSREPGTGRRVRKRPAGKTLRQLPLDPATGQPLADLPHRDRPSPAQVRHSQQALTPPAPESPQSLLERACSTGFVSSRNHSKRPPSVLKALQRNDIATPFASERCARL
jgi:DNA-binding NtrC family response regulator